MENPLVAANWKMHKTLQEAEEFAEDIKAAKAKASLLIFPPSPYLARLSALLEGTSIEVGAQNMHAEEKGAFTGEISAAMVKSCGASRVLLGHSERRQHFGETNASINGKVKAALKHGLKAMLCIGETSSERESGRTMDVLRAQLEECLGGVSAKEAGRITIAYEPVWAIGTGKTATPQQAQEAHAFIRKTLSGLFGKEYSKTRILYGGSVTPENAASLFREKDVDGALVGGASLDVGKFLKIGNAG